MEALRELKARVLCPDFFCGSRAGDEKRSGPTDVLIFRGVKIRSSYGYAATVALGEEEWRSYPIPAGGITSPGRGFDGAGASVEAQRASKLKDWKCTSQLAWAVCSLGMWTAPHGFLPQRWDAVWYCACLENHQDATSVFNVFEVDWGHNS